MTFTSPTSFRITSSSHKTITATNIESVSAKAGTGSFNRVYDFSGSADSFADTIELVSTGGGNVELTIGASTFTVGTTSDTASITIIGSTDDDLLVVDHSNGVFSAPIIFQGGAGQNTLSVIGNGTFAAAYVPSATTTGDGSVTLGGGAGAIVFEELSPVDISGMTTATLSLPSLNDVLQINNGFDFATGLEPALVVSGTSGGVAIETVAFFDNDDLVISTTTFDGNDTITVNSADNAHLNNSLVFDTGSGTDSIVLSGNVTTTGTQAYMAPFSLTTDATLTATVVSHDGGGDLGANTLTVSTTDSGVGSTLRGTFSGTGGFTKAGPGLVFLTSEQTYTGPTTVEDGSLSIMTSTAAASNIEVQSGGTLIGEGTLRGSVTVQSGGILTTGFTFFSLPTGNLNLSSGSNLRLKFGGPGIAGSTYDQVRVAGTVSLAGDLNFIDTSSTAGAFGDEIILISNDGTDAVSGTFNGLAQNDTVTLNGETWRIVYNGGDGNDVALRFGVPTVSVSDAMITEGNTGTAVLTFNVSVNAVLGSAFSVNYASSNVTTTNADYTPVNDTLNFTGIIPNETLTVSVTVLSDQIVELDETILLTLTNIVGTTDVTFADNTATGTIVNDDAATLSISDATIVEGNTGSTTYTFVVTLDNNVDTGVSVTYDTADGTATVADSDYTALTGQTLNFAGTAGETQNVVVTVAADTNAEQDETFLVNLSAVMAGMRNVTIADAQGIGTIIDDDRIVVNLSADLTAGSEAGTTVVTLTATADSAVMGDQSVDLMVSGTNVTGTDYALSATSITILSGQTTGTVTFTVQDDALVEIEETAVISIDTISAGLRLGTVTSQNVVITDNDAATLSINDVTMTETDSGTFDYTFTVTLDNAVDTGFTVDYATGDGTATAAGADYNGASGTLTFVGTAAETQTITVTANGDDVVELNESFFVVLSNLLASDRNVTFDDFRGAGFITNDDSASLSISDVSISEGDSGTSVIDFIVTLTGDVDTGVVVSYATSDGTATLANGDYVEDTGNTISFVGTSGETKTISITINGDPTVELDETFLVTLSDVIATGREVTISDAEGVGTISNDDVGKTVNLSVNAMSGTEADQTVITITATTVGAVSGDQTIDLSVAGVSATDYVLSGQTITILDGQTSGTATFTIANDSVVEALEIAAISISNPTLGLVLGSTTTQNVVISDNDAALISINDVSIVESDAGTTDYVFTVTLNSAVDTAVSLNYATADGGATTAGSDYTATSGTLNFAGTAGETQTITVSVAGDEIVELDELFLVNLSAISASGRNVTFIDNQGRGTIVNDDTALLSINDVSQAEGDSGSTAFTFTVTLDSQVDTGFSVDFATSDGTATVVNSDYTAITGNTIGFTGNLGETQTLQVIVSGDTTSELDETFFVTLSNIVAIGRNVALGDATGQGLIHDDDGIAVDLSADVSTATEAGETVVTLTVTAATAVSGDQTVDLVVSGPWITSGDYVLSTTTVTILDGQTTGTATFTVTNDLVAELAETAVITLANPSLAISLGTTISQSVAITDNDVATLSIGDATITEGDSGTSSLTFTVTLDVAVDAGLTVDYATADSSATVADSDYASASGTLTFTGTAGETQTITVDITGDEIVELDESFFVNLLNLQAGGRSVTIADAQAVGTITNNDSATFTVDDVTLAEGDSGTTTFTFTVTLDKAIDIPVTLDIDTADSSATVADNDYSANTGVTLNFTGTAGETMTFDVQVNGDTNLEFDETFFVNLSNLVAGGRNVSIADIQALGTISDDDGININLSASALTATEAETTQITLTVTADSPVTADETVDIVVSGTSITTGDYVLSSGTITILTGQTTGTATFTIANDDLVEGLETAVISLANASIGLSLGSTVSQSIAITSDDAALVSIDDVSIAEGASGTTTATFTVTVDKAVDGGFTVDFATADGTATIGNSDYVSNSGTLTFAGTAGETQTITVVINGDADIESDETYVVDLANIQAGGLSVSLSDAQGLGTITNDNFAVVVNLSADVATGTEAANTVVNLTVTADSPVVGDQTVDVQVGGTNVTSADYVLSTVTITILSGQTTGTATFTIATDGILEGTENATISIANPSTGVSLGSTTSVNVAIADNTTVLLDPISNFPGDLPTLTWQAVPGAVRYEIWVGRVFPSQIRVFSDTNIATTSWTPPGTLDPAFYRYWVRAFDADNNASPWSANRVFEVQPTLISPLTPTFSTRPTFAWDAIPFAPGYEIFVRTKTGDIRVDDITGTSWTPTTDLPAGNIRWWIRSSDAQANRGWSIVGETNVDRRSRVTGPVSPTTDTTPTITWQAVEGAGRYVLYVQDQSTNSLEFRDDNLTTTSYTPTTAWAAGTYRVWVKAIDASTNLFSSGVWSNAYDFTITSSDVELETETLDSLLSLNIELTSLISPVREAKTVQAEAPAEASVQQEELTDVEVSEPAAATALDGELELLDAMMSEPLLMATLDNNSAQT